MKKASISKRTEEEEEKNNFSQDLGANTKEASHFSQSIPNSRKNEFSTPTSNNIPKIPSKPYDFFASQPSYSQDFGENSSTNRNQQNQIQQISFDLMQDEENIDHETNSKKNLRKNTFFIAPNETDRKILSISSFFAESESIRLDVFKINQFVDNETKQNKVEWIKESESIPVFFNSNDEEEEEEESCDFEIKCFKQVADFDFQVNSMFAIVKNFKDGKFHVCELEKKKESKKNKKNKKKAENSKAILHSTFSFSLSDFCESVDESFLDFYLADGPIAIVHFKLKGFGFAKKPQEIPYDQENEEEADDGEEEEEGTGKVLTSFHRFQEKVKDSQLLDIFSCPSSAFDSSLFEGKIVLNFLWTPVSNSNKILKTLLVSSQDWNFSSECVRISTKQLVPPSLQDSISCFKVSLLSPLDRNNKKKESDLLCVVGTEDGRIYVCRNGFTESSFLLPGTPSSLFLTSFGVDDDLFIIVNFRDKHSPTMILSVASNKLVRELSMGGPTAQIVISDMISVGHDQLFLFQADSLHPPPPTVNMLENFFLMINPSTILKNGIEEQEMKKEEESNKRQAQLFSVVKGLCSRVEIGRNQLCSLQNLCDEKIALLTHQYLLLEEIAKSDLKENESLPEFDSKKFSKGMIISFDKKQQQQIPPQQQPDQFYPLPSFKSNLKSFEKSKSGLQGNSAMKIDHFSQSFSRDGKWGIFASVSQNSDMKSILVPVPDGEFPLESKGVSKLSFHERKQVSGDGDVVMESSIKKDIVTRNVSIDVSDPISSTILSEDVSINLLLLNQQQQTNISNNVQFSFLDQAKLSAREKLFGKCGDSTDQEEEESFPFVKLIFVANPNLQFFQVADDDDDDDDDEQKIAGKSSNKKQKKKQSLVSFQEKIASFLKRNLKMTNKKQQQEDDDTDDNNNETTSFLTKLETRESTTTFLQAFLHSSRSDTNLVSCFLRAKKEEDILLAIRTLSCATTEESIFVLPGIDSETVQAISICANALLEETEAIIHDLQDFASISAKSTTSTSTDKAMLRKIFQMRNRLAELQAETDRSFAQLFESSLLNLFDWNSVLQKFSF